MLKGFMAVSLAQFAGISNGLAIVWFLGRLLTIPARMLIQTMTRSAGRRIVNNKRNNTAKRAAIADTENKSFHIRASDLRLAGKILKEFNSTLTEDEFESIVTGEMKQLSQVTTSDRTIVCRNLIKYLSKVDLTYDKHKVEEIINHWTDNNEDVNYCLAHVSSCGSCGEFYQKLVSNTQLDNPALIFSHTLENTPRRSEEAPTTSRDHEKYFSIIQ